MYFVHESICCVCTQVGVSASLCWYNLRGRWRTVGALQGIATWQEHSTPRQTNLLNIFMSLWAQLVLAGMTWLQPEEAVGGRSFQLSLYLGSRTWVTSSQSWRESPWAPCHAQHVIPRLSRPSIASSADPLYGLTTVQNVIASDAAISAQAL